MPWDPLALTVLTGALVDTSVACQALTAARTEGGLGSRGATPRDHRILPKRIILVRHAESEGNVDNYAYTYVPDPQVPLVRCGCLCSTRKPE